MGSEGFEVGEGAAGCHAGLFEERRIEYKGTPIYERMVGGFVGLAREAGGGAGDEFFVHLQIGLKLKRFTKIPAVMPREAGEIFFAESGALVASHGLGLCAIVGGNAASDEFESAGGNGEQSFALEKIEKIAVHAGVHLQRVAAVLDDVGIHEAGDGAFAEEGIAQELSESGSISDAGV